MRAIDMFTLSLGGPRSGAVYRRELLRERVVREASAPLLLLREPASMGARASYDGVLDAMRWNVPAERGA